MPNNTPPNPRKPSAKPPKAAAATRKPAAKARQSLDTADSGSAQVDPAVVAFLRDLDHPMKAEVQAIRQLILDVSPTVREGIKWNAPSFRTTDHFATFNLRARDRVDLILHTGAKVKATAEHGVTVADPAGLLKWLAKDRCLVTFRDSEDVQVRGPALQAVLREWVQNMPG